MFTRIVQPTGPFFGPAHLRAPPMIRSWCRRHLAELSLMTENICWQAIQLPGRGRPASTHLLAAFSIDLQPMSGTSISMPLSAISSTQVPNRSVANQFCEFVLRAKGMQQVNSSTSSLTYSYGAPVFAGCDGALSPLPVYFDDTIQDIYIGLNQNTSRLPRYREERAALRFLLGQPGCWAKSRRPKFPGASRSAPATNDFSRPVHAHGNAKFQVRHSSEPN